MVDKKRKHSKEIIKAESNSLNFFYADGTQALKKISLPVYENKITALIGPSGCGKSTFLRCFNRTRSPLALFFPNQWSRNIWWPKMNLHIDTKVKY